MSDHPDYKRCWEHLEDWVKNEKDQIYRVQWSEPGALEKMFMCVRVIAKMYQIRHGKTK